MSLRKIDRMVNIKLVIFIVGILALLSAHYADFSMAAPQGASIISSSSENGSIRAADSHTAQGGSFTTLLLNVSSQTSKWKAYVGNVSGKITLDNSLNQTLYDWSLTNVQGEVYVSRNQSVVFSALACANSSNVTSEQNQLGINSSNDDSINNTFKTRIHKSFTIGGTGLIANSSCLAIATFINDTSQVASESATFQEILMSDSRNLVYVSILENKKQGFDSTNYDFQIIVPDDPSEAITTYYFYAELG